MTPTLSARRELELRFDGAVPAHLADPSAADRRRQGAIEVNLRIARERRLAAAQASTPERRDMLLADADWHMAEAARLQGPALAAAAE
jgi:hypothetical protein